MCMMWSFGFQERVVDLFFHTFSNNWFSVLINGEPTRFFQSSQGVQQGDPLSPSLFLLVAEFLGRGIHHLILQDERGFYVTSEDRIPYLAFANDTIIFVRCS